MMTDDEIAAEQALIKEQSKDAHITDLLRAANYTDQETRDSRLDICRGCDRLIQLTTTCKECGCFMVAKTWLKTATCPKGLWGSE